MTGARAQAIIEEIKKYASIPERGDDDLILPDIYRLTGVSRQQAITILERLLVAGVLVEYGPVWTKGHRRTTAYRLAEGRTYEDIGPALT